MRNTLRILALLFLFLLSPQLAIAGTDAPTQSGSAPSGLILFPGSQITLIPDERIQLSVVDSSDHHDVNRQRITWTINGQPAAKLGSAMGVLTADKASAGVMTFTAPHKAPPQNKLSVSAEISGPGSPVILKGTITIAPAANWFAMDGDTGHGPFAARIQPNPNVRSNIINIRGTYMVHSAGTLQDAPGGDCFVDLSLDPNHRAGTYAWGVGNPYIGVTIMLLKNPVSYWSLNVLNIGRTGKPTSFEGTTTVLEPLPGDPTNSIRGCYEGRLAWTEDADKTKSFKTHYVNVHGHFKVP